MGAHRRCTPPPTARGVWRQTPGSAAQLPAVRRSPVRLRPAGPAPVALTTPTASLARYVPSRHSAAEHQNRSCTMFAALARFAYRRRRPVLVLFLLLFPLAG